ncbi:MAG: O-antigen ligase family protein, partial [Planctomycetota bacterium]
MSAAALDAPATPTAEPTTRAAWASARWWRLPVAIGLMVGAFAIIEHDLIFANASVKGYDEAELRDRFIKQIRDGNLLRQIALLVFGGSGVAMIGLCTGRRWRLRWSVVAPLAALLLLAVASVGWSVQPAVTAKRIAVLLCLLAGAAGLARFLTPTELLRAVLLSLVGFIAASFAIDIAFGGRPWQVGSFGEYRFGGTLHPNAQAAYCGVMCVAAACLPVGFGRRWVTRSIVISGLAAIVLTQSRTGLLSVLLALVFVAVLRLPRLLRLAGIAAVIAAASGAFVVWHSVGDGARNRAVDAALLGRNEQSKSLTGRVPLWDELAEYAAKRPVLGYGYEGFWTPKRIAAIMKSQNWTV